MTDSNGDLVDVTTKILQRFDPLSGPLVARAILAVVLDDLEAKAEREMSSHEYAPAFLARARKELGL